LQQACPSKEIKAGGAAAP